jgi:hypothetical protein
LNTAILYLSMMSGQSAGESLLRSRWLFVGPTGPRSPLVPARENFATVVERSAARLLGETRQCMCPPQDARGLISNRVPAARDVLAKFCVPEQAAGSVHRAAARTKSCPPKSTPVMSIPARAVRAGSVRTSSCTQNMARIVGPHGASLKDAPRCAATVRPSFPGAGPRAGRRSCARLAPWRRGVLGSAA